MQQDIHGLQTRVLLYYVFIGAQLYSLHTVSCPDVLSPARPSLRACSLVPSIHSAVECKLGTRLGTVPPYVWEELVFVILGRGHRSLLLWSCRGGY